MAQDRGARAWLKRGAFQSSSDICSVCQKRIPFLDLDDHMKTMHPDEYSKFRIWMAAVVVAFVVPIAVIVVSYLLIGGGLSLLIAVVCIAAIVASQLEIDHRGKRWEADVQNAWRAAHPSAKSDKSRSGRRN